MTISVTKKAINLREELADLRKPSGIAGEAVLRADTTADAREAVELSNVVDSATGIDVTGTVTADGLTLGAGGTVQYNADRYFTPENNVDGAEVSANGIFRIKTGTTPAQRMLVGANGDISFYEDTGTTPKFFWDASAESLMIGKTTFDSSIEGFMVDSRLFQTTDGLTTAYFNRLTNDGNIVEFRKDGATVGSIGVHTVNEIYIANSSNIGLRTEQTGADRIEPCYGTGAGRDNGIDLGSTTYRFDDIYATNGSIQTSDRNEKQDIEELSEAEQRIAVACKGLMRKFRWKDAVEEKGDDARIHFGIIAQDLQAAFEAEGLDAGKYAMFISTTWWEAERVIPAVEAVEEHTVTDTFDTLEEAPEGATERTRMGVRYTELLAFIIGAI